MSKVKSIGENFVEIFDRWNLKFEFENPTVRKSKNNGSIEIKMLGQFFDSVHEIYISGLKTIMFVTVKDIFDLENEKFNTFSPFLMIFDEISWTQMWISQWLCGIRIFWESCTDFEPICDRSRASDTHSMFRNERYFFTVTSFKFEIITVRFFEFLKIFMKGFWFSFHY